jgi:hypothetical protein
MALNPVERRLALLCEDWLAFRSDPSKRLLVWQVPDHALRLVQCFVQAQKHDLEYASRDLFVAFDAPFQHSVQYARTVKEQLLGQVQASRDGWVAQGLSAGWSLDPRATPDTAAAAVDALRSLGSSMHRHIGHLAAVLLPAEVADPGHWSRWLARALQAGLPERLRLVVVDSLDQPRLAALAEQGDPRVSLRRPAVHGLATAQETFAQEATLGPAGVFRNLLMGVVGLMEHGSAEQVRVRAADALQFARRHGWADQEVVLRIMVAGALLKEQRHAEAVQVYQVARQAAGQALQAGHPAGRKLALQTWFGEAGAQLAAGDAPAAARCYDAAAQVALEDQNPLMALEARRMGAFCHARAGDAAGAQQRALQALEVGARLQPQARAWSTLPLAALELLRSVEPARMPALQQVQARWLARQAQARDHAEQQAAAAEGSSDPAATAAIQAELEHREAQADEDAERELQAVVAAAPVPWQQHFAQGRDLLGAEWPLHSAWSAAVLPAGAAQAAAQAAAEAVPQAARAAQESAA